MHSSCKGNIAKPTLMLVQNGVWGCQQQYSHLDHPQCSNTVIDPKAICELCGFKTSDDRTVRLACIFFSGLKFQNASCADGIVR